MFAGTALDKMTFYLIGKQMHSKSEVGCWVDAMGMGGIPEPPHDRQKISIAGLCRPALPIPYCPEQYLFSPWFYSGKHKFQYNTHFEPST